MIRTTIYPEEHQPAASGSPLLIGKGYAGFCDGQMDDVRIYSRTLDWQEILGFAFMVNYPYEGL